MTKKFNFLGLGLAITLLFLCTESAWTQTDSTKSSGIQYNPTDPKYVRKTDARRHADWEKGKAQFPGRPRDMWQLGIGGGSFLISGDVKPQFGWGASVHVRKSIGYVFSLKLEYMFGQARGLNYQASGTGAMPGVYPFPNSAGASEYTVGSVFYANYFMPQYHAVSLQTVYNLNNIKFHKKENKWALNLIVGAGGNFYQSRYDALDANGNAYSYVGVAAGLNPNNIADRRTIRSNIKGIMDGDYETPAQQNTRNQIIIGTAGKAVTLRPFVSVGMSVEFLVTKRFAISLEHQAYITGDDFLDGKNKKENGSLTSNIDIPHYTSIRLNFHLGNKNKRIRPLWFVNPLIYPMQDVANLKESIDDDLLKDTDGDGVPDLLDEEPDTPPDTEVDTKGVTKDSDRDGVPDSMDDEPHSLPGYPVDEKGVAQVPPPLTEEDVAEIGDERYELKGNCCDGEGGGGTLKDWYLPMIHFDRNKYYLRPEAYAQLQHVAAVMRAYPDLKVVAHGHTDTRQSDDYNKMLSYNRAMTAIEFLANTYGVDKNRFVIRYDGESKNLIPNTNDEQEHFINRRVEFYIGGDDEKSQPRPDGDGGVNRNWKY